MAQRATRPSDGVEAAADELYGLPLNEFTAARNESAKRARGQGDSDAAAAISKLAKPNAVAWLANQLVREHAGEIRPLLELGDSMRRATASLDAEQLRELSGQQRQLVHALVQQAQRLANAAGQAVSDSTARGLADTLHAALADENAARQLSQGRLTTGLSRSGFPGIDASAGAAAAWPAAARGPARPAAAEHQAGPTRTAAAARRDQAERARRDEVQARDDAEDAQRARGSAQAALAAADQAARAAADRVNELNAELDAALKAQAGADRARRQARQDADRADRADRRAQQRLQDATARRTNLER
jgi:hypothetical protein